MLRQHTTNCLLLFGCCNERGERNFDSTYLPRAWQKHGIRSEQSTNQGKQMPSGNS